jgi:hypothetical protein
MKSTFIISLILVVIISCSPKTKPTASNAKAEPPVAVVDSTSNPIDLAAAENQFRQTCSSCHKLPDTKKHTAEEWPKTVNKMQRKKNGFSDEKKALILAYLTANAKK